MNRQFLFIFSLILIFVACKKEGVNTQDNSKPAVSHIEKLILDFKQRLEAKQKDGTVYSADSAVWYVEALLNYSNVTAGIECSGMYADTAETNLLIPETREYTLNQLETVYNHLMGQLLANQPENTIVFAVDLFTNEVETVIVFAAQTAYATPVTPQLKATNDTSGYWYWGGNAGMCGSDSGLYVGMDATDILTSQLTHTWTNVWTSMETHVANPAMFGFNYYDPNFPFTSYPELDSSRIFHAIGEEEVAFFCLTPDMMHYYASSQGIGYIINDLKPAKKYYAHCFIEPGLWDYIDVFHEGSFTYGIPIN